MKSAPIPPLSDDPVIAKYHKHAAIAMKSKRAKCASKAAAAKPGKKLKVLRACLSKSNRK